MTLLYVGGLCAGLAFVLATLANGHTRAGLRTRSLLPFTSRREDYTPYGWRLKVWRRVLALAAIGCQVAWFLGW